jgi:hypothetical protein
MPSDNPAVAVDQDGVGKSKLFDAGSNPRHLLITMRPAIPCIRDKGVYCNLIYIHKGRLWLPKEIEPIMIVLSGADLRNKTAL